MCESLLNECTVLKLYMDVVEFNDTQIMEACTKVIIEQFDEIIKREESETTNNLLELDIENFINILKSDNLNLLSEEVLVNLVRRYIEIRDNIKPAKPKSAEELTQP